MLVLEEVEILCHAVGKQSTAHYYFQSPGGRGRGGDSEEGMQDSKGVWEERHIWLTCTHYTGWECANLSSVSPLRK